jgi:secreted trypsin-like serine protease
MEGTPMRKVSILIALLLILAVGALPALAITWGQRDTEHTNVGAIVVDHPRYGPYQICSGTLIDPQVFLTAGHCTDAIQARGYTTVWVNFDEYALNETTLLDVEQVITHPDYNWGPYSNPYDVGALILAEPVMDIEPATLPEEGFLDRLREEGKLNQGKTKAKFTVVGYGGTLDWPPPEVTYEDYRQFAVSEYRALLKAWLRMSQNQATDDGGTCYGDSGGPAFWEDPENGTEILVGITSWGDVPCVSSGFNYRVDIPETLDFIHDVIAGLE